MADPITIIGLAASVVQLADYSAKLSVKLFSVSKQIKNAPRTYEAISQEVATTSTVLHELGAELKDHSQHNIYKPATVSTTKSLLVEFQQIFHELTEIAEPNIKNNAGSATKALAEWKHRLKLPSRQADIVTKRARLEQLKGSLNVLLNVLVLAAQVKVHDKSEEANVLLREQHDLLLNLKDGMNALCLVQNAVRKPKIEPPSGIPPATVVSKFASVLADTKSSKNNDFGKIPPGIRPHAKHIKEHARLIDDLIAVIKADSYDVDRRTRLQMRKGTYALHCQIWAELSSKHDFYDMEHLLVGYDELADEWFEFVANVQPTTNASKSWMSFSRESALPQSSEQDQLDELRACFDALKNRDELLDINKLPMLFEALGQDVSDRTGAALLHRLGIEVTEEHINLTRFLQIAPEIARAFEADPSAGNESRIPRLTTVESSVPYKDLASTRLSSGTSGFDALVTGRTTSRTSHNNQNRVDRMNTTQRNARLSLQDRLMIQHGPLLFKSASRTTAPAMKHFPYPMSATGSADHGAGMLRMESSSETASLASEDRRGAGPDEELDSLLALFADLSTDEMRLLHTATTLV